MAHTPEVPSLLVYMSEMWAGALLGTIPRGPLLEARLGDRGDKKKLAWQVTHASALSGVGVFPWPEHLNGFTEVGGIRDVQSYPSRGGGRIGDV